MNLITASNRQDYELKKAAIADEKEVLISVLYRIMEEAAVGDSLCDLCPKICHCRQKGVKKCLQTVASNL